MAKQLNVSLSFNANTAKAKQQILELQSALDNLIKNSATSSSGKLAITKELSEAQVAASKLQTILSQSMNVKTGNLDLTKFSEALNTSGLKLSTLKTQLDNLGPSGQKAFMSLAQSVVSADVPLTRTSKLLSEMWTTMQNTVRWQLSSSILHGVIGAYQSAMGYAKSLDSSLNNIRIVTGQSADEMARFAENASRAAKQLSATTTEYTNASLIYYQQGLSDAEVAKRTEVTIKMANAAGQSAEIVSDQLTAVWNNFYDGSKSLEYYADVMTALGAATASSTDEISQGLQKFAAVADTVGLSYEYATAALATITSNTRESADVVGNALKTLFARIQGLQLGETLEDGTDLNKYSEALDKVGISIYDQNGQLKNMDQTLSEMASKWENLSGTQQVALAQTVAGVRQYTQLVALMENWDSGDSDSMIANLNTVSNSKGVLQEQADIYAESWEAARDRVKAASEDLFDSVLDENFFIDLLNGFEKVISITADFVDSLNGLPGVLTLIASIMTRVFSSQIAQSINNIAFSVESLMGKTRKSAEDLRNEALELAGEIQFNTGTEAGDVEGSALKHRLELQQEIQKVSESLTQEEQEQIVKLLEINDIYAEQALLAAKAKDAASKEVQDANLNIRKKVSRNADNKNAVSVEGYDKAKKQMSNIIDEGISAAKALDSIHEKIKNGETNWDSYEKEIEEVMAELEKVGRTDAASNLDELYTQVMNGEISFEQFANGIEKVGTSEDLLQDNSIRAADALYAVVQASNVTQGECDELAEKTLKLKQATTISSEATSAYEQRVNELKLTIQGFGGALDNFGTNVTKTMQGISSLATGIQSIIGAFETLKNPDLSFGEKLLRITMSLSMAIPSLIAGMKALNKEQLEKNKADLIAIGTGIKDIAIKGGQVIATWAQNAADKAHTGTIWGKVAAWIAEQAAAWPVLVVTLAIVAAIGLLIGLAAGLIAAVNAISDAYNADAIAAENAKKAADNLAEAYGNVKSEYEDMISTMENYQSARNALDDLTEGTQEYEAALKEANRAALELINKYNLIEGQDYDWQGDQLIIDDTAMKNLSSQKEAEVDQAYAAQLMAQANAKSLQTQSDATNLKRQMRDDVGLGNGDLILSSTANVISGALGMALAPVTGGLSLIASGVAALDSSLKVSKAQEYSAVIDKAIEESKTNANLFDTKDAMAEALDLKDEDLINALWENRNEVQNLANEMNAAEAAWKVAAQNSANEILNNNEKIQRSKNGEDVMAAGGRMYDIAYKDAYQSYMEGNRRDLKADFQAYAKDQGLTDLNGFKIKKTKKDHVEYEYVDDEGKKQTVTATKEEIAATLAAAEAAKALGQSAEALLKTFNQLDASGQAYDQAMKNFLTSGNFENSTKQEATAIMGQVDTNGSGDVGTSEASTYLGTQFGDGNGILTTEEAQSYGYESAAAMIEAFTNELNNIDKAWESIELPDNLIGVKDLSLKTAQAIENTINDLNLGPLGEEAGRKYVDGLNKMIEGLDPEKQQEALDQLSQIDWSDWDAMEQADAIMKALGKEINTTSEEWVIFTQKMRAASLAIPDFSKLKEDLIGVTSILSELDMGSSIGEEDYARLIAYNDEWERYFMLQADGSRKFIGNSAQMRQETRENIQAQREELAIRKEIQQGMQDNAWKVNGEEVDWYKSGEQFNYTDTAQNLINADSDSAMGKLLAEMEYTDDAIQKMIDDYNAAVASGDEAAIAAAEARFKAMYDGIGSFMAQDLELAEVDLDEMMASTASNTAELNQLLADGSITLESYNKQSQLLVADAAANASTLAELNAAVGQVELDSTDETYTQNLMRIASGYDSCKQALEAYQIALNNFDPNTGAGEEALKEAEDQLKATITLEEAAEKYDLSSESLIAQANEIRNASKESADGMELSAEQAAALAVSNQRLNKGLSTLNKNWKDWKKTLNSTEKTSQDYADVLVELSEAVEDLTGWYEDLNLDSKFVTKNMGLIEAAAEGDMDAIITLGAEVAKYSVAMAELDTTLSSGVMADGSQNAFEAYRSSMEGATSAADAFIAVQGGVQAGFDNIINNLSALQSGETSLANIFGGEAGLQEWVNQLNAYAAATGMTAQQMQSMLSSVGVTANVQADYQEQDITVPTYREEVTDVHLKPISGTRVAFSPLGDAVNVPYTEYVPIYTRASVPAEPLKTKGFVEVASISMDGIGEAPGVPAPSFTGRQAPAPSSTGGGKGGGGGGGGGGSAPTPAKKVDVSKKADFGERYHTVNKQIDNMAREMDRASKSADKLWSRQRLQYLAKQNEMLDQEIALLQEKTRQAEEYLKQDKSDLDSTALDLGFTISYGADGEILNYDAIRDAYAQQMIAAQQYMNTLSTQDEQDAYNETVIEPLQKKIDAFEEAMELYYDSLETIQDNADLIQEKLDQKLQNNFDMWAGELELDIAINDRDLELLEYYLGKIEDDVYQMAEAAALMVGSLDGLQSGNFGGQLGEYLSQLGTYNTKLEELNQKLAAGEITEAAYEEGLETIRTGLLDNLQAIQELDNAMLEYYSNTLDAVMEEMDKYTEKLEHQTSILEHYANMMEILGKSYDYKSMGEILEGQVKTLENELKVAEAEYDLYKSEAEEKRKLYEEAVAAGNVEAAEVYKKEWEAAEAAAMEAQSDMLDKTEAWAEAMRAVVENNLKGLAKTLEESLTGGTAFDQINLQLERAASLQEEYLTTTNKIYETNKLMRTAQQEIDKTTNTVAKQRLKDFIKETNQLQDKSKLSKYELEIQQAKYDLLLAQLALEDAQNAKSTVRLQRDSEGNFGYVYTADQNKLAEAQQALEDAQNSLYNIGLEGANDYTEKYAETMQEMYDTLTSITEAYFNGEIASQEEYEAQMLAAQQYYYEQLENYQDLYGIALQTDTRVIKDAWSTGMQIMTIETNDWKNAVKEYTNDATKALVDWYAQVDAIANKTGLDNIANKVKQITDESDKLKDKILGTNGEPGVIQALADELTAVSNLTGGYANLRATLQGLIEDYEELMRTVIEAQNTETPIDSDTPNDNPDVPETEVPDTEDPTPENPEDTDPATTNPEDVDAPILKKGDSVTVKSTATHFSRNGGNGTRMRSFVPGSTYSVMDFDDDEVMIGRNGVVTGWVKKTDLVGFNTGGYTGSWGPYGKLAILDEKELVLNQGDTANFLASMEVLERILEMLDVQSASAQLGGLLSTPIFGGNNTSSSVEQNVHIEASFPSVTDRNEIEEAFNNLINTASQYANRKI